jgi:hypothetical protein
MIVTKAKPQTSPDPMIRLAARFGVSASEELSRSASKTGEFIALFDRL